MFRVRVIGGLSKISCQPREWVWLGVCFEAKTSQIINNTNRGSCPMFAAEFEPIKHWVLTSRLLRLAGLVFRVRTEVEIADLNGSNDRRECATRHHQKWETGTGLLVMDLHVAVIIDWHAGSPLPMTYTKFADVVSALHECSHASQNVVIQRAPPHKVSLITATVPQTEFAR